MIQIRAMIRPIIVPIIVPLSFPSIFYLSHIFLLFLSDIPSNVFFCMSSSCSRMAFGIVFFSACWHGGFSVVGVCAFEFIGTIAPFQKSLCGTAPPIPPPPQNQLSFSPRFVLPSSPSYLSFLSSPSFSLAESCRAAALPPPDRNHPTAANYSSSAPSVASSSIVFLPASSRTFFAKTSMSRMIPPARNSKFKLCPSYRLSKTWISHPSPPQ